MYSNHIFPITDLPRGLGLKFFSLVYSGKKDILCLTDFTQTKIKQIKLNQAQI